jgi:thiamine biosynthesis lipoprotein
MSVHTFEAMGTMVSIRITDANSSVTAVLEDIQQKFSRLNQAFSLYREDSEISQIARGELALADSSEEMREEYARALDWREKTDGAFTPHRPDGVIDLSGTIKAVAIDAAAQLLHGLGFTPKQMAKRTRDMSGGWRMRVALARALFAAPTLLLLGACGRVAWRVSVRLIP